MNELDGRPLGFRYDTLTLVIFIRDSYNRAGPNHNTFYKKPRHQPPQSFSWRWLSDDRHSGVTFLESKVSIDELSIGTDIFLTSW